MECDARLDPLGVVRVSHEPLDGTTEWMELSEWMGMVRASRRSAKIDLKEGGMVIDGALEAVANVGLPDDEVWFNAAIEIPGGGPGFRQLSNTHPGARISCPLDTLGSYLLVAPPAYEIVELLRSWGINWLCFGCRVPGVESLVPAMQERGWPVNIWDVEDGDGLDKALSLNADAITADLGSIQP